jgi:hypothetical protein
MSGSSNEVTIYFPPTLTLFLEGTSVKIQGSSHPNGPDCQLILKNCHTTIGGVTDIGEVPRFLGALSIRSSNSAINFLQQMHIRDLKLELDDSTEVSDLSCQVEKIHIQAADNANIIISGEIIRKLLETNRAESK